MAGAAPAMRGWLAAAAAGLLLACACGRPTTPAGATAARPAAWAVATTSAVPRPWWHPRPAGPNEGPEFQWELDHPLNIRLPSDTGSGAVNSLGARSGATTLFDIDGITNPASTVRALHALGDRAICYIEVGAAGDYYPAGTEHVQVSYYQQFLRAHDLGATVPGYPERYLNINAASTVAIVKAMIRQQCAAKGFDAVEPDIDDSYADATGFRVIEADNVRYDRALAAYAHGLGLAWGQKNGDGDPGFSRALEPATDFLLVEECEYYQTCGVVTAPYTRARKLVLDAEYTQDWGPGAATDLRRFCPADAASHLDGTLLTTALAGPRNPCR